MKLFTIAATISLVAIFSSLQAQVIISQYYEGASNDKYLEITNYTTASVDLTSPQLYVTVWSNANAVNPTNVNAGNSNALTGVLAPGASIILKNSSASTPTYASSVGTSASACTFNGNDLVTLATSNSTPWDDRIDIIGNGSTWGANTSFYRNSGVVPNTTYTPSEWTQVTNSAVNTATSSSSEYLGFHATVLPVSLVDFQCQKINGSVNLAWTTASEVNNDYFAVERSENGYAWETIGMVKGQGTTKELTDYTYVDERPMSGVNYYRLHQQDFDGTFTKSPTKVVRMRTTAGTYLVYPNPAKDYVNIDGFEQGDYILYNALGQVEMSGSINNSIETLDIDALPAGRYMIQVINAAEFETLYFVK